MGFKKLVEIFQTKFFTVRWYLRYLKS